MTFSTKQLALAAAFAGLMGGTAARAAQPAGSGNAGVYAGALAGAAEDAKIEKHACKGMNSCKGQGGGDKDHWGKNECKGKGACRTDGKKPKM